MDFLRDLEIGKEELTKSIIGTIGDVDSYQLPDAKGYTALMRHLLKVTDEERQERREQILGTTQKDFKNFADALESVRGAVVSRLFWVSGIGAGAGRWGCCFFVASAASHVSERVP